MDELWPLLIDTVRLNEATGFPRHSVTQTVRSNGSVERIARGKLGPFLLEWEDNPWEWEEGHKLRNVRQFRKGIFKSIAALLELLPEKEGCRLHEFTSGMEPDEIFSRLNHYFSWAGKIIAR